MQLSYQIPFAVIHANKEIEFFAQLLLMYNGSILIY